MSTNQTAPDTMGHFYDLRALAMSASAMTRTIDEGSDELNAVRRVLRHLADKALEFANEIDHADLEGGAA